VTEGYAGMSRTALRLAREEPEQVLRLQEFRVVHPQVIIGDLGFGVWQACHQSVHASRAAEQARRADRATPQPTGQRIGLAAANRTAGRTKGTAVALATDGAFWTAQRWSSPITVSTSG
jgi:hypothetical protein